MPKRLRLFLAIVLAGLAGAAVATEEYELSGKVVLPGGDPLGDAPPIVLLEGAMFPYSSRLRLLPSGEFKFKDLEKGPYRLTILVPGWGQMNHSIDIGPATADSRNRIERVFEFTPERNTDGGGTVDPLELTLPRSAWRDLGKAEKRLEKRDTAGAIEILEKLLKKYPHFSAAWNRLGTIAFLTGRYADAEEHFSRALEEEPDAYAPLVNIGAAYLALGKVEPALETNARCVEIRPRDPLAWSQLGQTYFVLGRLDESLRSLSKARELDSAHSSYPQLVMAEIYRRRGDHLSMVEVLEEFLALHPDYAAAEVVRDWLASAGSQLRK